MNMLLNLLQSTTSLTQNNLQKISAHLTFLNYSKNEYLLKEGQIAKHLYFIETGYLRSYEIVNGLEKTMNFGKPQRFMTHLESFTLGCPSDESIQAITDCEIVQLSKNKLEELSREIPPLIQLQNWVFQEILRCKEERLKGFIQQKAIDRYKNFVRQNPELAQVVSVNHLASYIGVAPETLSRIRSKVIF